MLSVFTFIKQRVSFSFHALQERVSCWIKPRTSSLALGALVDLTRGKTELLAENALVLATWVIRSGNRHFENGMLFLYRLQTKKSEGKIGSRHCILMVERRPSHMKEQRIL